MSSIGSQAAASSFTEEEEWGKFELFPECGMNPRTADLKTFAILDDTETNTFAPNSGVPPALILAGLNAYNLWNDHWEHWSHMPPLEERTEYPFQNIRTRNYPWGDGD